MASRKEHGTRSPWTWIVTWCSTRTMTTSTFRQGAIIRGLDTTTRPITTALGCKRPPGGRCFFKLRIGAGILPIHNVGVEAFGRIPSGRWGLHYVAEVGNGRASRPPLEEEPV